MKKSIDEGSDFLFSFFFPFTPKPVTSSHVSFRDKNCVRPRPQQICTLPDFPESSVVSKDQHLLPLQKL
jgi:hypothetical protein